MVIYQWQFGISWVKDEFFFHLPVFTYSGNKEDTSVVKNVLGCIHTYQHQPSSTGSRKSQLSGNYIHKPQVSTQANKRLLVNHSCPQFGDGPVVEYEAWQGSCARTYLLEVFYIILNSK